MAPQASKKCGLLPPDHRHIGIVSCTSNGISSEQVPGTLSVLTISSLSPQASAQIEKRLLTPFLSPTTWLWGIPLERSASTAATSHSFECSSCTAHRLDRGSGDCPADESRPDSHSYHPIWWTGHAGQPLCHSACRNGAVRHYGWHQTRRGSEFVPQLR
jgi:hypothetical protein